MILVADSGSSNSDWMLDVPDSTPLCFKTKGLNPFFVNEKEIERVLKEVPEIIPYAEEVTEVYFFGAGCVSPDRRELVSNALTVLFPNSYIQVESDILGSAYAVFKNNEGLICTLGTGSDVGYYNGKDIIPGKYGNGYVLGDEGSGTYFGKKLITNFLYGNMPKEIHQAFEDKYKLTKELVIRNVYQKERPNAYLASFAEFMSGYISDPFIVNILRNGFDEYVRSNILGYPNNQELECCFVGKIAYNFDLVLREVCQMHGVKIGKILEDPMQELFEYVLKKYGVENELFTNE